MGPALQIVELERGAKTRAGITVIPAGETRLRYRLDLVKAWPRRAHLQPGLNKEHGGNLLSSWRQMPAVQKQLEFTAWSKEEGSLGEMGLVGSGPLRCVARVCPSCIFCPSQLHFTNPLAHKFIGKCLEEDFEHVLIVDLEIGW